ncbi:hypothetical protein [Bremerella volcania]|nr:hypothetical protein [Bremerella volcania]
MFVGVRDDLAIGEFDLNRILQGLSHPSVLHAIYDGRPFLGDSSSQGRLASIGEKILESANDSAANPWDGAQAQAQSFLREIVGNLLIGVANGQLKPLEVARTKFAILTEHELNKLESNPGAFEFEENRLEFAKRYAPTLFQYSVELIELPVHFHKIRQMDGMLQNVSKLNKQMEALRLEERFKSSEIDRLKRQHELTSDPNLAGELAKAAESLISEVENITRDYNSLLVTRAPKFSNAVDLNDDVRAFYAAIVFTIGQRKRGGQLGEKEPQYLRQLIYLERGRFDTYSILEDYSSSVGMQDEAEQFLAQRDQSFTKLEGLLAEYRQLAQSDEGLVVHWAQTQQPELSP